MAYEGSLIFTLSSGVNGVINAEGAVYVLADGRSLSKTTYSSLYAVLSGRYGQTASEFTIPDLRGYFLRGDALNTTRDADIATRVLYGPNAVTSGVGTLQPASMKTHSHNQTGSVSGLMYHGTPPAAAFSGCATLSGSVPNTQTTSGVDFQSFNSAGVGLSGISLISGTLNPPSYSYYLYIKAM